MNTISKVTPKGVLDIQLLATISGKTLKPTNLIVWSRFCKPLPRAGKMHPLYIKAVG